MASVSVPGGRGGIIDRVIVGIGRYCGGQEVDAVQSQLVRGAAAWSADAASLVSAMYSRASEDPSDFVWIGVAEPTREELVALGDVFGLPRLWVDDALNPRQRAKAEFARDGSRTLIVFKIVTYDEPTSSIDTGQVALLVGPSFVLTVRLGPLGELGAVRDLLVGRPTFLSRGPLAAVHGVVDTIVDGYLSATDEIGRDVDDLEEHVFSPEITDDTERISRLKRENLELRRAVSPLVPLAHRMMAGELFEVGGELATHFSDIGEHLLRAHDYVEGYDNLLMTMLQASNARQQLQQNTDMRRIAAYAALLALPTAIAGIYGMNFRHMPELDSRWGYPGVMLLMVLVMLVMYRAFKRSRWL